MLPPLRDFSFWTYQGHQHSAYQYPYPVNQTRGQPFSHFNHAPHHSVSSTATNAIYTPSSTGYTSFLNPSTIQPSAFQGWQNVERDGRARSNTVSGSLFGGEHPGSRSMERSFSRPNICQDDRRSDKLMVSPSISEQQSEESWEDKQIQVIYITDADIKQTQEVSHTNYRCSVGLTRWRS